MWPWTSGPQSLFARSLKHSQAVRQADAHGEAPHAWAFQQQETNPLIAKAKAGLAARPRGRSEPKGDAAEPQRGQSQAAPFSCSPTLPVCLCLGVCLLLVLSLSGLPLPCSVHHHTWHRPPKSARSQLRRPRGERARARTERPAQVRCPRLPPAALARAGGRACDHGGSAAGLGLDPRKRPLLQEEGETVGVGVGDLPGGRRSTHRGWRGG